MFPTGALASIPIPSALWGAQVPRGPKEPAVLRAGGSVGRRGWQQPGPIDLEKKWGRRGKARRPRPRPPVPVPSSRSGELRAGAGAPSPAPPAASPPAPRGAWDAESHLPPCPAAAGSRRKTRTLSGGPASASGAASLRGPGSPGQRGRQGSSARPSGDAPPLATGPAWAASQTPRASGRQRLAVWLSRDQSDIAQSPLPTSARHQCLAAPGKVTRP